MFNTLETVLKRWSTPTRIRKIKSEVDLPRARARDSPSLQLELKKSFPDITASTSSLYLEQALVSIIQLKPYYKALHPLLINATKVYPLHRYL